MNYSFIQDIGLVSILLFLGFAIRFHIKFLQKLFIPVSIITGVLALFLGNNGFDLLPFSEQIGSYPGIMISFLFGALPFTFEMKKDRSREFQKSIFQIGSLTAIILLLQWGIGLLFSMTILQLVFPEINQNFGSVLAAGFFGGHGTAAALGDSFTNNLNWEEGQSLAMTSATFGVFAATIGGVIWIQWGVSKNETVFLKQFQDLPKSLKTGLIPLEEQRSIGKSTFSNISVDPLLMHIMIVVFVGISGIYLTMWTKPLLLGFSIPSFSFSFIVGIIIKQTFSRIRMNSYFDTQLMNRVCGIFADLIVIFGIASINVSVVIQFALPLVILFIVGVILSIFLFMRLGSKVFTSFWFEKSIFLWGMSLGVTAIGIALLRMVDSEGESETLPNFAIGYIGVTPLEITCLVSFPILASQGYQWYFTLSCILCALLFYYLLTKIGK
jgi:glutamate:Na+ symporter, ESS family